MTIDKNKVIQLFPNETYKKNEFCLCGRNRKESPGNLLFKQTTEWRREGVRSETNVVKSTVEVFQSIKFS